MSAGRIGSTSPPFCPLWRRTSPHTGKSPPTHSNGLHRHQKRPPIQAIRCTHQIPIRKTESHTHTWERLWMGGGEKDASLSFILNQNHGLYRLAHSVGPKFEEQFSQSFQHFFSKIVERFTILRFIRAQGPCKSSLYHSNFSICNAEAVST